MFWRSIGFVALALLWHLPAQLDAFVAPSTGCHHNGTWYADKSLVPTLEKCLNCQCNRKTLVCRLKVCPEMPMPPPRGCIVVQKKNTCCPYLSCARLDAFYKIPATRRIIAYLDHYERESIDRVVNENMLQRRSDDSDVDLHVCVKNGTVYKSGSAMSSSNLCTYCYCIGGSEKCVKPKCMLPVEGCKPIFVDSTCCPVRYDCTAKASGKSSQEVRYRKTSNKHFLRMSQRLQRNRGCTVGLQFYSEGQKMKSDADRPCDICFCIRGTRRCAPKKCSPALKNCMPVVPKGHCCPSSYDCGSQRDYRRAQNSRQFNLFSLFFGNEDAAKNGTKIQSQYPLDRHPSVTVTHKENILQKHDEKSIFDTIREGLEIIDGNNEQVLAQNIDKLATQTTHLTTEAENIDTSTAQSTEDSSTTAVSFLDLLLGSPEEEIASKVVEDVAPEVKVTTAYDGLSWVDLLLGPDDEERKSTISDKLDTAETTTHYQDEQTIPSIDRLGDDVSDDYSGAGEIVVGELYDAAPQYANHTAKPQIELNTEVSSTAANADHTTEERSIDDVTPTSGTTLADVKDTNLPDTTEKVMVKVKQPTNVAAPTSTPKPKRTTVTPRKTTTTTTATTTTTSTTTTTARPVEQLYKTDAMPLPATTVTAKNYTTTKPPEKRNDLLTALLDGISDMLSVEKKFNGTYNKSTANKTKTVNQLEAATAKLPLKPHNLPTPKPLPSFKPLPTHKPHVRINSKIANLTVTPGVAAANSTPHNITFKPLPALNAQLPLLVTTTTPLSHTTTATATTRTTTTKLASSTATSTTTTLKPLVIKTNPTILESEPLESNAEPTLPPSLPNLKIIPFLPTDAVKSDKPLYDYYHSNAPAAKVDYDLYDEPSLYPSITERYASYADVEDGNKAEYIYKFNVEGPVSPAISSTAGQLDGTTGAAAFVKYDFAGGSVPNKGFSPPTKTEGGFVPKQPLIIDDEDGAAADLKLEETGYQQVTKHIIDITTGAPMRENTTKVIEITTPDPFKDVIRTEPPPDLTSLIEDKENIFESKQKLALAAEANAVVNQSMDKHENDIIHITTGKPEVAIVRFNSSQSVQLPAKNKTMLDNPELEHKNSIEAFLDLLLRDEEHEEQGEAVGVLAAQPLQLPSSAVPPFKTLPQTAIQPAPAATSTVKTATVTATTTTPATPTTTTTTKRAKTKARHPAHRNHNNATATITSTATKPVSATLRPKTTKPKGNATRRATTKASNTTSAPAAAAHRRRTGTTTDRLPTTTTTAPSSTNTNTNTMVMSPFDKLPFMDASFEVKRTTEQPIAYAVPASAENFLGLLQYKNSLNKFEGLEPAYESFVTTTSTSAPSAQRNVAQLSTSAAASAPSAAALDAQHTPTNSLINPTGILKLAGCNIYGRMYRVGRIILELSSPCLECKCTEVGVKCGQLDC